MKQLDLTAVPLRSGIFYFSLPLVFTNLLQVAFNMCDVAVAGRFAGPVALGAVGSTPQLVFFMTGLLMGFGGGVNVIAAFYTGSKKKRLVDQTVHTTFIICLLAGFMLLLCGQFLTKQVLQLLKTKQELLPSAVLYLKIFTLGMPAVAIFNWGNALLNAVGDTKRPLIYLAVSGVINTILNLIFVIGFKLDVAGVAWASVISQYVSVILIYRAIRRGAGSLKFHPRLLHLNPVIVKKMLRIGIPSGLQNVIFSFANMFVQAGINTFSAVRVAGISAASEFDPIVYNVMNAIYSAGASFIGQNHGANSPERVKKTFFITTEYSFFIALILGAMLFIAGDKFLMLFTTDPEVIAAGLIRIKIMAFSYCISAFMDNTIAANRGLGHTFMPSVFVMLGSCVFRVIWVYTIFARYKTVESLFSLYVVSWLITAFAEIVYFVIIFRKEFKYSLTP